MSTRGLPRSPEEFALLLETDDFTKIDSDLDSNILQRSRNGLIFFAGWSITLWFFVGLSIFIAIVLAVDPAVYELVWLSTLQLFLALVIILTLPFFRSEIISYVLVVVASLDVGVEIFQLAARLLYLRTLQFFSAGFFDYLFFFYSVLFAFLTVGFISGALGFFFLLRQRATQSQIYWQRLGEGARKKTEQTDIRVEVVTKPGPEAQAMTTIGATADLRRRRGHAQEDLNY